MRAATTVCELFQLAAARHAEREALRTMVEEYATAIRSGSPPLTDGRSGLRVLEMLEAASRSLSRPAASCHS